MIRIYFVALGGAAIFLSYFVGMHVANIKCNERSANTVAEQIITHNSIWGATDEEVMHTGVGDIRLILREKYTIAE